MREADAVNRPQQPAHLSRRTAALNRRREGNQLVQRASGQIREEGEWESQRGLTPLEVDQPGHWQVGEQPVELYLAGEYSAPVYPAKRGRHLVSLAAKDDGLAIVEVNAAHVEVEPGPEGLDVSHSQQRKCGGDCRLDLMTLYQGWPPYYARRPNSLL